MEFLVREGAESLSDYAEYFNGTCCTIDGSRILWPTRWDDIIHITTKVNVDCLSHFVSGRLKYFIPKKIPKERRKWQPKERKGQCHRGRSKVQIQILGTAVTRNEVKRSTTSCRCEYQSMLTCNFLPERKIETISLGRREKCEFIGIQMAVRFCKLPLIRSRWCGNSVGPN